jgi:hypothetical protein
MIKNKNQLLAINKLNKGKVIFIPKDKARFYVNLSLPVEICYCFDKEMDNKKYDLCYMKALSDIPVDSENKLHSYNVIPINYTSTYYPDVKEEKISIYCNHGKRISKIKNN